MRSLCLTAQLPDQAAKEFHAIAGGQQTPRWRGRRQSGMNDMVYGNRRAPLPLPLGVLPHVA